MATLVATLRLASAGVGVIGAVFLFLEFFQLPSYVSYDEGVGYQLMMTPDAEITEHTWLGRTGALLVAVAFALQFASVFLS